MALGSTWTSRSPISFKCSLMVCWFMQAYVCERSLIKIERKHWLVVARSVPKPPCLRQLLRCNKAFCSVNGQ